jgi:hypothetical protein
MSLKSDSKKTERYNPAETRERFEAALRGAKIVGHKPQSEMKLGKKAAPKRKSKRGDSFSDESA